MRRLVSQVGRRGARQGGVHAPGRHQEPGAPPAATVAAAVAAAGRSLIPPLSPHRPRQVGIAVEAGRWDEARRLAHGRPELAEDVYLPHARALLAGDRFDEALVAFRQAGKGEEAARLLEGLTRTAVSENRIRDAGYYYWQLAREAAETPGADQAPERFKEYYQRAEMYFAYSAIRQAQEEPFRFGVDERVLMETARLLLCMVFERGTNAEMPFGALQRRVKQCIAKRSAAHTKASLCFCDFIAPEQCSLCLSSTSTPLAAVPPS